MRNGKFANKLLEFMIGRNGPDQLSRFLAVAGCITLLLALLLQRIGNGYLGAALAWLSLAGLVWCYFRMFSKRIDRRQSENRRYLEARYKVTGWFRLQKDRVTQRKDYVFYRCPGCHSAIRAPRGKGRIRITCRRCGYSFERKT